MYLIAVGFEILIILEILFIEKFTFKLLLNVIVNSCTRKPFNGISISRSSSSFFIILKSSTGSVIKYLYRLLSGLLFSSMAITPAFFSRCIKSFVVRSYSFTNLASWLIVVSVYPFFLGKNVKQVNLYVSALFNLQLTIFGITV